MDDADDEFQTNLFRSIMETWVEPEIVRRQDERLIPTPFALQMAQVLFYPDNRLPSIRLNEEIRGRAVLRFKEPLTQNLAEGAPIYWHQVEGLDSFELDPNDGDCGHASLFSFDGAWAICFNFIYNKFTANQHLEIAKSYLHTAKTCLAANNLHPFVENLGAASELTAKAFLMCQPNGSVISGKTHGGIHSAINRERHSGSVSPSHVESFNKLRSKRNAARYLEGELHMEEKEAVEHLQNIEAFIEHVDQRIRVAP